MNNNSDPEMAVRLNQSNLAKIPGSVAQPTYDRSGLGCGIVHMSVGGFHRSHQALYLDDLLKKTPGDWMICGVGSLPNDKEKIDALRQQDCLYSVVERNAQKDSVRIVGSIKELLHAPTENEATFQKLVDPATKILSLTITEKGYCYNSSGDLDRTNPDVVADLADLSKPKTALGFIVASLKHRRDLGIDPYTVMSCDNLPGNGNLTRKLVLQFAKQIDFELSEWILDNVCFPNAMVDRITPVTTSPIVKLVADEFGINDSQPVVCEDYIQWVLEDDFNNGRPALEEVGVQLVKDVEPYEKMKVRLLNGSHSALSYLSYLMGYREVDVAMADPLISKFVRLYMDNDITDAVPKVPGVDLEAYKDTLIERFANPAISDQVQRLAEDGSQKIPNAILPCIQHQLQSGGSIKFASLALAGWFRYLSGTDENSEPIDISDPLATDLVKAAQQDPLSPKSLLEISEVFGTELSKSTQFVTQLEECLKDLHEHGARTTLELYCK